jgi:glucan phosphoethanolaminetransferase (alkaline phosphatase superfamily)
MTAGVLLTLVTAKALVLLVRGVPLHGIGVLGYFWHDGIVAALIALLAWIMRTDARRIRGAGVAMYVLLIAYVAINVPVMLVLATPLTGPMLHGTGSALGDSIRFYVTPGNLAAIAVVLIVGASAPVLLRGVRSSPALTLAAASALAVAGFAAHGRVDTAGWERNALTALIPAALPAVAAAGIEARHWRASDEPAAGVNVNLTAYRGAAAQHNVLTIVLESTAAQYLGMYGASKDPTPNLTSLSRRALVFDRAYAVYPESIKGLYATLCARYPAFGVAAEAHADAPCASAAQLLGRAGYRTALFHSGRFRQPVRLRSI